MHVYNGQEARLLVIRKEPVRFDSFRLRSFRKLIGLIRFGSENSISQFDAVRPAVFRTRSGAR